MQFFFLFLLLFVCLFVSKKDFVYVFVRVCSLSLSLSLSVCVSFVFLSPAPISYTFIWNCSIFTPRAPFLLYKKRDKAKKQKQLLIRISSSTASRCGCKSCNTTALISPAEMLCVVICFLVFIFFPFLLGLKQTKQRKVTKVDDRISSRLFRYHLCCKFFSPFSF